MAGEVFGQGAGEDLAWELSMPFLGRLKLRAEYRSATPAVLESEEIRQEYERISNGIRSQRESGDGGEPQLEDQGNKGAKAEG